MPRLALWCALALLVTGCTLTTPPTTPMPTPDLPQVRFLFPENNAQIYEGAEINVDILAEDGTAGIASIAFYVDGVKINEGSPEAVVSAFRAQMNWVASGVGGHTLQAVAVRPDGTTSLDAPGVNLILVEVVPQP